MTREQARRATEALRIGSLFSGIGGLELGLETALSARTIWQVEKDPFCRAVLAKHWPDAQRFDDVCTIGEKNLEPVDIICGGFPCQDLSFAGKGAGLGGERSGLWFEYARIVRELRPRIVVIENVAALLVRGIDTVLGELAALGYDAWWDCIPASAVGAPHQRDRLFIVAYAPELRCEPVRTIRSGEGEGESDWGMSKLTRGGQGLAYANGQGEPKPGLGQPVARISRWMDGAFMAALYRRWPARPGEDQKEWEAPRVAVGVPNRSARLKALGNAVVPAVGYVIGCAVQQILEANP